MIVFFCLICKCTKIWLINIVLFLHNLLLSFGYYRMVLKHHAPRIGRGYATCTDAHSTSGIATTDFESV